MKTRTLSFPSHTQLFLGAVAVAAVALSVFALYARAQTGPEIAVAIHTAAHSTTTQAAIGTSVHARASVATTTGTTTPTGTVDFDVYANTSCSGTASSHNGVALVNGTAESSATAVTASGLSYRVAYSGDSNNVPSESACISLTATGPDAAVATSLSTTTALVGTSVFSAATLSNVTSNASGTVAYKVYTNNACSAGVQNAGTKSVTNASVPNSDSITFNTPGTFYWQAAYSGDSQNDAATSTCANGRLTILATSTPTGRIIVDKVTVPSGATTTFAFNASGGGYDDFSLADGTSPNEQTLTPGTYRITESSVRGWKLTSAACSRNGAASTTYAPGAALTLNSGDTIVCTFTNTQATSTGNGDKPEHGKHKGFLLGLPFGILKKVFNDVDLPSGIFKKFDGNWQGFFDSRNGDKDNDGDNSPVRERLEKIKDKVNWERKDRKNDD